MARNLAPKIDVDAALHVPRQQACSVALEQQFGREQAVALVVQRLRRAAGNMTLAAQLLGWNRVTLWRYLRAHNLGPVLQQVREEAERRYSVAYGRQLRPWRQHRRGFGTKPRTGARG